MYGRKAIMTKVNPSDPNSTLRLFAQSLVNNDYYDIIVENLLDTPGFVNKSQCLVESKSNTTIVALVVFDTKENFDAYANDPATTSIFNALQQSAQASNVNLQIVDGGDDVLTFNV